VAGGVQAAGSRLLLAATTCEVAFASAGTAITGPLPPQHPPLLLGQHATDALPAAALDRQTSKRLGRAFRGRAEGPPTSARGAHRSPSSGLPPPPRTIPTRGPKIGQL